MKYFSQFKPIPREPSQYESLANAIAHHEGWDIAQQDIINIFNEHEAVVTFWRTHDDNRSWKMHECLTSYSFKADDFKAAENAFYRMCEDYLLGLRKETGEEMSLEELELRLAVEGEEG